MKQKRELTEYTYQVSPSAPPCIVTVDPDPLSYRRYAHTARWTWTDEEAIFFASIILARIPSEPHEVCLREAIERTKEHLETLVTGGDQVRTEKKRPKRLSLTKKGK